MHRVSTVTLNYRPDLECICCGVFCITQPGSALSVSREPLELNESVLVLGEHSRLLCSCSLEVKAKYFLGLENERTSWNQMDLRSNPVFRTP